MVKEKISNMGFIAINKIEKFLYAVESSFRDCKFRIGCMHLKIKWVNTPTVFVAFSSEQFPYRDSGY